MLILTHLTSQHQKHIGSLPRDGNPIKLNGAIHVQCTILKLVAASAAEAKLGAMFLNAQDAKVFA
jgi:hypothetical protein